MVFAGEVFPEWYWGPIFFYFVFGLPLAAAAFAVDFARPALGAAAVVAAARGPLGWASSSPARSRSSAAAPLIDHVRFERDAQAAAQNLDFTPYRAGVAPGPRSARSSLRADDFFGGAGAHQPLRRRAGRLRVRLPAAARRRSSLAGRALRAAPPRRDAARTSSTGPAASCARRAGAPSSSALAESSLVGDEAFALLDGTLVRLQHDRRARPRRARLLRRAAAGRPRSISTSRRASGSADKHRNGALRRARSSSSGTGSRSSSW